MVGFEYNRRLLMHLGWKISSRLSDQAAVVFSGTFEYTKYDN